MKMKKYIVVGLLMMSFIITPVFVSAQTPQSDQIATLIRLLQSLVQLLQQQLLTLRMQNPVAQTLSPQQRADILRNLSNITVLSPNGGEEWARGANLPIRWNMPGNSRVDVMLKFQSCGNDDPCSPTQGETVARNVSGGSYNWIVGNVLPGGTEWDSNTVAMTGNYKIQICLTGTQTCDFSDFLFRIVMPATDVIYPLPTQDITVLSPNGGETFKIGNQIGLAYDIRNIPSVDTLSIQLKKMSGSSSTQIIADTPSNSFRETYWWTIPAAFPIGNDYKITIYAKDSTGKIVAQDSSDASFTIGH
jgi:hypothetical protein